MLKHLYISLRDLIEFQPPSGGCVLKRIRPKKGLEMMDPAAFRRLCVETFVQIPLPYAGDQPPSGGCVLKHPQIMHGIIRQEPAAFRRLCVETSAI